MSFCRTGRIKGKKGMGLTDVFSIIAIVIIFLAFYLIFRVSLGNIKFNLIEESGNWENSVSLMNILRTPVTVDGNKMDIAELISVSTIDNSKKQFLEKTIKDLVDNSFGTAYCSMVCINGDKIKGSGCNDIEVYICPYDNLLIPGQDKNPIKVSFKSEAESLSSKGSE